jgi:hypothetical protein
VPHNGVCDQGGWVEDVAGALSRHNYEVVGGGGRERRVFKIDCEDRREHPSGRAAREGR